MPTSSRAFLELVQLERDDDDCRLMLVATSETESDVVYVTEVWASEPAWRRARRIRLGAAGRRPALAGNVVVGTTVRTVLPAAQPPASPGSGS